MKSAIGKLFAWLLILGGLAGFYAFFFLGHWWLLYLVLIVFGLGWIWEHKIAWRLDKRRRARS